MTNFKVKRYIDDYSFEADLASQEQLGYVLHSWKVAYQGGQTYQHMVIIAVYRREI